MHHSFGSEYAAVRGNVLDFSEDYGIMKARGDAYAKTWFYSRYDGR